MTATSDIVLPRPPVYLNDYPLAKPYRFIYQILGDNLISTLYFMPHTTIHQVKQVLREEFAYNPYCGKKVVPISIMSVRDCVGIETYADSDTIEEAASDTSYFTIIRIPSV